MSCWKVAFRISPGICFCLRLQIPNRALPPILRESHAGERHLRVFLKKRKEPSRPTALRGDAVQAMLANGEDTEEALIAHLHGRVPVGIVAGVRDHRFVAEFPVPEARVVGTDVPHGVQREQPGFHHGIRYAEDAGDRLFHIVRGALVEGDEAAEGEHLRRLPKRRHIVLIAVFFVEMLNEGFLAAGQFLQDSGLELGECRALELRPGGTVKRVGKGAVLLAMMGGDLRTQCDLESLDGVDNEHAQPTVEGVATPNGLERGAGDERLVRLDAFGQLDRLGHCLAERMPVAAEPVVANHAETLDHEGAISRHAALQQEVHLLLNGKGWLLEFHARPPHTKENPPRDSMSCDRGPAGVLGENWRMTGESSSVGTEDFGASERISQTLEILANGDFELR